MTGNRWISVSAGVVLVLAGCSSAASSLSPTGAPGVEPTAAPNASPTAPPPLEKVTLRLGWVYGGPFAPWYIGKDKGFFADQGIDLVIEEGNGSVPAAQSVASGKDDFGYLDVGAAARLIDKGLTLKSIAQIRQKTSMAVIALASKGITKPKDLEGHSISHTPGDSLSQVWPGYAAANHLDLSKIDVQTLDFSIYLTQIAQGKVDAIMGYVDWEGFTLDSQNVKTNRLLFADSGINIVDYGVVASNAMLAAKPDLVKRFLAATVKSWDYAVKNVDEAVAAGQKLFPQNDAVLAKRQVEALPQWFGDSVAAGKPIGWVDPSVWQKTLSILSQYEGVKDTNPADYFTNDFLPTP